MKRILIAAVLLSGYIAAAVAQNQSQRGMAGRPNPGDMLVTQRQVDSLEARVEKLERDAERAKAAK